MDGGEGREATFLAGEEALPEFLAIKQPTSGLGAGTGRHATIGRYDVSTHKERAMKKFLAASLAVFVWLLIFDHLLSNAVVGSAMASVPGVKANYSAVWEAVGDLCSALVLCGFYGRVRSIYGAGWSGGAVFGVYAGTLLSFPTWLNMTNYFGWPYLTAWHLTIVVILLYAVAGAIAGMVYKAMSAPQPAA